MLRFILKNKQKLISGAEIERVFTIDNDLKRLEKELQSGGFGEDQYSFTRLIGVEVINK